jgi:glycosyltransferase involved in cell wall biosynthesis
VNDVATPEGTVRAGLGADSRRVASATGAPQAAEARGRALKVAYLINQYPKVSHTFVRREIQALERQGIEVLRLASRGWADPHPDAADQAELRLTRYGLQGGAFALIRSVIGVALTTPTAFWRALRLALHCSRGSERPWPVHLAYLAQACRFLGWLRASGVDHVHAHFGTNPAEVAMLIEALGGPGYSFTVHGPEEFDKPQAIGLARKIERSRFVVAVSSFGRSQLYRWVGERHWPKVRVVHCGLEPAFHQGHAGPVSTAPRLVCVGRLCEQKGQLLLVQALSRLVGRGLAPQLVLAGDGEMRTAIEAQVAEFGLRDHVTITGWVDGARVRTELLAARALVLPSFAEGLPVVIMEAMALGRPVISTYVAGIPELVLDGQAGWLVPAGDVEALADAMQRCLDAPPDRLAQMGERAHERVLQRHDADREAARLAGHFRAALTGADESSRAVRAEAP